MVKSRKSQYDQNDSSVFLFAFLIVLLVAAGSYATSGPLGAIFSSLTNALRALGLNQTASCPFYRSVSTPAWACIAVFGIVPFIIVYYFTFDALSFTFLSTKTKSMLSLGVSMIASIPMNGKTLITNVSQQLTNFTSFAFGSSNYWPGFLMVIIFMAAISAFMGQLAITTQVTGAAVRSVQEAVWGYRAINQIGRTMVDTGKRS
ncbi:MAG: hypothetical protein V1820_03180 [archaeon]